MADSGAASGALSAPGVTFEVGDVWLGAALGPTWLSLKAGMLTPIADGDTVRRATPPRKGASRLTVMPGVIDHHVHLGLVDRELLADGPLVEVHDLGWDLEQVSGWRDAAPHGLRITIAGPFHTALGGYPSGRSWAPAGAVRAVRDCADARAAVAHATQAGVDAIKIALQTEMPVLDDDLLQTLIDSAHAAKLPAIVHAEGVGQAQRAIDAGADTLVHAPWSEPLPAEVLLRAARMTWISTLAIHAEPERAVAIDNLGRFHELGGTVRYGTDMGNGPTPAGINAEEINSLVRAGLNGDDLITALTGPAGASVEADRALVSERPLPTDARELIAWLADCRRFDANEVGELQ